MPFDAPSKSWRTVSSSNVDAIRWQDDTLYVRFLDGNIYWYEGFNVSIYWEMLNSPSKGKFVHQYLYHHQPQGKL